MLDSDIKRPIEVLNDQTNHTTSIQVFSQIVTLWYKLLKHLHCWSEALTYKLELMSGLI